MGTQRTGRHLAFGFAACAALLLSACATETEHKHRWTPNGEQRSEDWHSPTGSILKYDANHDGTLTRAELEAGLRADFDAFDIKHTGCLTQDQVTAINEARASSDQAAYSPLIDWKQSGCVDYDAFAATTRSVFEQLDTNADGKLTPDELKPKGHRERGEHGGEENGGHHGRHGGGGDPDGDGD